MKLKTFCAVSCLMLAAVLAVPPPAAQANGFDDLLYCTAYYLSDSNSAWETWNYSAQTQNDVDTRNSALDTAFNNYQACNSLVNVDTAQFDFCTGASEAAQQCLVTFQDNYNAWMACRAATRVDVCQ